MASPAELAQPLPTTLPEDFGEWDGEDCPAALPADLTACESSSGSSAISKPSAPQTEPRFALEPQVALEPRFALEPQVAVAPPIAVAPKVEVLHQEPPPAPPSVSHDHEALRAGLRAVGAALKGEPIVASNGQTTVRATKDDSYAPMWTNGAVMDAPRIAPSPLPSASLPPTVCADDEAFGGSLRALGAALNSAPVSAAPAQPPAGAANDVTSPPVRTGVPVADARRNAPPPLPHADSSDEEDFFNQLRTIGSVLNTQPFKTSHKVVHARVTDEFAFKPAPPTLKPAPSTFKPAPPALKQVESNGAVARKWPTNPIPEPAAIGVAESIGAPMFRSDLADSGDENPKLKKWIKVGAIGVAAILLLVFICIRLLGTGKPTLAKQSVQPPPAVADAEPMTNARKPSPETQLPASTLTTTTIRLPYDGGPPGAKAEDNPAPQADPQPVNDQFTAAPRIPSDVKVKVKTEEAPPPPGFSAANTDAGDAGAIGGVFGEQAPPKVAYVPYPRVTIAAGVADGLLIQRTQPVYPPDAWYNGVTGKVVLEVNVSRAGTVENLHFVGGSHRFEKAALNAVKTWHYRPYTIDNVPREFQTTVEVTFDQKSTGNPLSLLHFGSHSKNDAKNTTASLKSEGAGAP
jgi:periplasmic protein TonB